jgi:hypothetical protein
MRRTLFLGAFLLVEGESDRRFFDGCIDQNCCKIRSCGGEFLRDAVNELNRSNFQGFLAVADADFHHLTGGPPSVVNIVWTDLHDLECILLQGMAFNKLVAEFASLEKLGNWDCSPYTKLLERCLEGACQIGALLWHSKNNNIGMSFDKLDVNAFTDRHTLLVDRALLIKHVKNKSSMHHLADEDLLNAICRIEDLNPEKWQVSRGHDFIDFLGFAFRFAVGSQHANDVSRENLERCLRLAYPLTEFVETNLYKSIVAWELQNTSYPILKVSSSVPAES